MSHMVGIKIFLAPTPLIFSLSILYMSSTGLVIDESTAALPHRRHYTQKRPVSQLLDSLEADAVDTNSRPPDQIRRKFARLDTYTASTVSIHKRPVDSTKPSIVESAIFQLQACLENRLDKVKENLRVWESNGIVTFSPRIYPSFLFFSACLLFSLSLSFPAPPPFFPAIYLLNEANIWRFR
jgi:hypothetical protein